MSLTLQLSEYCSSRSIAGYLVSLKWQWSNFLWFSIFSFNEIQSLFNRQKQSNHKQCSVPVDPNAHLLLLKCHILIKKFEMRKWESFNFCIKTMNIFDTKLLAKRTIKICKRENLQYVCRHWVWPQRNPFRFEI